LSSTPSQSLPDLPIIILEANNVIIRKTFTQEPILDDGSWLRPLIAGAAEKTQSQPDTETVGRIRETIVDRIRRQPVRLVA